MLIKTAFFCVLVTCCFAAEAAKQPYKHQPQTSKTYDAKGKLISKTTANGRHYDSKGKYIGKTTIQGRHYNAKGRYIGKTITSSSGTRIYDAKSKQVGKAQRK